jgi:hypothetical protein
LERGLTLMGQPRVGEQFQEILVSQTNLVDELIVFFIEAGYIEAD